MEACLSSLSLSTTTMMMFLSVLSCFAFCRAASSPFPALPHFYFLAIGIEILEKGKKNMFFCLASLGVVGEREIVATTTTTTLAAKISSSISFPRGAGNSSCLAV